LCDKPLGSIDNIGYRPSIRQHGFKHRINQRNLLSFESAGVKATQMIKFKNGERFPADGSRNPRVVSIR
jgi:hypothetical protein